MLGLPYRGIVYSEEKAGGGALLGEAFRINGLADEPKRLGLILLAGAIGLLFMAVREKVVTKRHVLQGIAVMVFLTSFLTYSASYLAALAIWTPVAMLLSSRSWKYGMGLSLVAGGLMLFMGDSVRSYIESQEMLLESREMEMDQGLGAQKVYRQEFFAEEYLRESPLAVITGVGMGRYYEVFSRNYGAVAGIDLRGNLLPLNSQAFELICDTGLTGLVLVYAGSIVVIWRLRKMGKAGYLLAALILFELIQSLFVQSLPLLVIAAGGGAAMLWGPSSEKKRRGQTSQRMRRKASMASISINEPEASGEAVVV